MTLSESQRQTCQRWLTQADAVLITAGAGMGVDSGLPDFRGNEGMWQAYPALGARRIDFTAIANPAAFSREPRLAWGFYGHRLSLYRDTLPHAGFARLRDFADTLPSGAFIVTSNVDGQFQKAGFPADRIYEIHGSIHWLQCHHRCGKTPWRADELEVTIDHVTCEWVGDLPSCPSCGGLARPNILMFGDMDWASDRYESQAARFYDWQETLTSPLVIEVGAGTAIPSIRRLSERSQAPLIRINPREFEVPAGPAIGIALGAREAIDDLLSLL